MEPSPKSGAIDELLHALMGKSRIATIQQGLCVTCNFKADHFRDALSVKEYTISGMCQRCQDSIFGISED